MSDYYNPAFFICNAKRTINLVKNSVPVYHVVKKHIPFKNSHVAFQGSLWSFCRSSCTAVEKINAFLSGNVEDSTNLYDIFSYKRAFMVVNSFDRPHFRKILFKQGGNLICRHIGRNSSSSRIQL